MKQTLSRKEGWPRKVQPGRSIVRVYRRRTPGGNYAYMVSNYADGQRRRFDSYADEADALAAAKALAKRLDKRDYVAASMTNAQALEYAAADQALKPFGVSVAASAAAVAECLKTLGDLTNLSAATKFFAARHKTVTKKPVAEVVAELLAVKEARGASARYMKDLESRLERFAGDCQKDACNVTVSDIQAWLDGLKLSSQSYKNYKTVLHTLFEFAVARGYATDNPVTGTEHVKVKNGDVEIYTPSEVARLLAAASRSFFPRSPLARLLVCAPPKLCGSNGTTLTLPRSIS